MPENANSLLTQKGEEAVVTLHVDEETIAWRERFAWQMLLVIGVGLALVGSYMGISAAFDDDTFCTYGLGCMTIDDTDEIWFGLIMTVVGVSAVFKARRQLR